MAARFRKRLTQDYVAITENQVKWCDVELEDDNIRLWHVKIYGPKGTGYEDGTFKLKMDFTKRYNNPAIRMITRIFHLNIDREGIICLKYMDDPNLLDVRRDGALILLQEIYDLMKTPVPDAAINPEALGLYCIAEEEYIAATKMFTNQYAKSKDIYKAPDADKGNDNDDGDEKKDEKDETDETDGDDNNAIKGADDKKAQG